MEESQIGGINENRGVLMNRQYKAVIKQDGDWWIGWIEELPGVNCQEPSREELMESLRVTLKEALEFNRQDALSAAGKDFQEETIAI
jgi:predicted RNase H-like HicB family nuclease